MSILAGYTLAEARALQSEVKTAIDAIVNGTAQSYKIGSREYTALSLKELWKLLNDCNDTIVSLTTQSKRNRSVVRVVPRDL